MYIGAYEPIVIYFGLTNSPAIFQTMMNDLFQDMINQRTTVTFINNIIIVTETKEEYNKIIEEVLKQLKENNLFVKLTKYKWKIKEVEFLKVIVGQKGVKIQKEKIEEVFNWPVL